MEEGILWMNVFEIGITQRYCDIIFRQHTR